MSTSVAALLTYNPLPAPVVTMANTVVVVDETTLTHALTANESVTWAIVGGADAANFQIVGSNLVWQGSPKDFENPVDVGGNNVYDVIVRATSVATGLTSPNFAIAVTVIASVTPTSLQSSITHGDVTFYFSVPVLVGRYADGQPFAISDRVFNITQITPDGVNTASGNFTMTPPGGSATLMTGQSYWANGVMIDPWMVYGSEAQGFDGMLAVWADGGGIGSASSTTYTHTLNVDPATKSSPIAIAIGNEKSVVKSIRRSGLTTPQVGQWRIFDGYGVLHIVSSVPPNGAIAPSPSATSKSTRYTVSMANRAALGNGFTLPSGAPDLATVTATGAEYFTALQPWWIHDAEKRRRFMVDKISDSGYSRDFGITWSKWLTAVLAAGQSAPQAAWITALTFGANNLDIYDHRSFRGAAGAGQWNGHKQFVQLFGHAYWEKVSGLMTKCLNIKSNPTHQPFYVPVEFVGIATNYPGNHDVYFRTFYPEDVGIPHWGTQTPSQPPPIASNFDSQIDADYLGTSCGAGVPEMLNIGCFRNGPNGWDGWSVLAGGNTWATAGQLGAAVAFVDRYMTFLTMDMYETGTATFLSAQYQALYTLLRNTLNLMALPVWEGRPECITPFKTNAGSDKAATLGILTATATGFAWNLTNVGHTTPGYPILEYQVRYSIDQMTWTTITNAPASGSVSNLPTRKYYVQFRRRNAFGWSTWSFNFPKKLGGQERLTVTPTNAASGAVVNLEAPKQFVRRYGGWDGPDFIEAGSAIDLNQNTQIYTGYGLWSGNISGTFTFEHQRDTVAISGAAATARYDLEFADLNTSHRTKVTVGGFEVLSNTITVPARPAQPAGQIIKTGFEASFKLYYNEVLTSAQNESIQQITGGTWTPMNVVHNPDLVKTKTVGEDTVVVAQGVIYGDKGQPVVTNTGRFPTLRMNLAARQPLTVGVTYRATIKLAMGATDQNTTNTTSLQLGASRSANAITSEYLNTSIPSTDSPKPYDHPSFTFTALSTELWIAVGTSSSATGAGGGDPTINEVEIVAV
jgi:hypothetical protein